MKKQRGISGFTPVLGGSLAVVVVAGLAAYGYSQQMNRPVTDAAATPTASASAAATTKSGYSANAVCRKRGGLA